MKTDLQLIATVRSPYKQKFAIPRQANLVPEAEGEVVFQPQFSDPNVLREIEQFSHLWLLFGFHATADQDWSPTVQPPRLGGKVRVGVFASRSPFRPNPIGMSVVKNLGYELRGSSLILRVGGLDLLDGTPVFDIKPYIPYADSVPQANAGFATDTPGNDVRIEFTPEAQAALVDLKDDYPQLQALITGVLRQDPRPAWRVKADDDKQYGMTLYDLNIKWRIDGEHVMVVAITGVEAAHPQATDDE